MKLGVVALHCVIFSELFTILVDMMAILVHGTLAGEMSEKGEENKKVYQSLIRKLKVHIRCLTFVIQLCQSGCNIIIVVVIIIIDSVPSGNPSLPSLHGIAQTFLAELCTVHRLLSSNHRGGLCSATTSNVHYTTLQTVGLQHPCSAFIVAGPVCWNSLPDYLKSPDLSFDCFN